LLKNKIPAIVRRESAIENSCHDLFECLDDQQRVFGVQAFFELKQKKRYMSAIPHAVKATSIDILELKTSYLRPLTSREL